MPVRFYSNYCAQKTVELQSICNRQLEHDDSPAIVGALPSDEVLNATVKFPLASKNPRRMESTVVFPTIVPQNLNKKPQTGIYENLQSEQN